MKRFSMIFLVFVLTLMVAVPAYADGDQPGDTAAPADTVNVSRFGGVVPPHGKQKPAPEIVTNLTYHGGPIMVGNKTYAIYWVPATYATAYGTKINTYFLDVAAAKNQASNVYYSSKEYYNSVGTHVSGYSVFGGSYNDTNPFPANGCPLYYGLRKCLSDAQIQTEIKRVIALNGWVANATTMFFMFTPGGVGSCFDSAGNYCAFSYYCAYHSYTGNIIYANQPYTYSIPNDCGIQYATSNPPNGAAVDSTLNVVSHEHMEAITDPHLDAWYDSNDYDNENGDKCAWNFGTLTASSYNQVINGHHYVLQQEWSNYTTRCVLTGY